jgi:2-phospho-L-lactate/phosphoenolpyruvate guanylyltransferase
VILIPVKNLSSAKQRLAAVLDQPSRTALAQAMLHDVLATLHNWKDRPAVAVVTSDPYAIRLAGDYQFEVIPDPDNPGETGAIEMATRICVERGVKSTLVIPADIPLIQSWELDEILKRAGAAPMRPSDVPRIYSRSASGTTASNLITSLRNRRAGPAS